MSLAKSYAQALYESSIDKKISKVDIEALSVSLQDISNLINGSRELVFALQSPVVSVKERIAVLDKLKEKLGLSSSLTSFLSLLARKNRLSQLENITGAFKEVILERDGGVLGEVISADKMSEADLNDLVSAFSKKLGKKIAFKTRVDSTLLAGLRVTVSGVTYDGTLKSQLNRLKEDMINKR